MGLALGTKQNAGSEKKKPSTEARALEPPNVERERRVSAKRAYKPVAVSASSCTGYFTYPAGATGILQPGGLHSALLAAVLAGRIQVMYALMG